MQNGTLPGDKYASRQLRVRITLYCIVEGELYWKIFKGPKAKCLGPGQTKYVMRKIHKGSYENYSDNKALK